MEMRLLSPGTVLFLFALVALSEARKSKKTEESEFEVESFDKVLSVTGNTLKIGSFNLKQFGTKKANSEDILNVIAKIIARYDLIALQEITDVKETAIKKLIAAVSRESPVLYEYVISPRVGRNKQKEQYALMFRPNVFQVKRHMVYDDSQGDPFSREPQIAEVILKPNGEKFGIINVHVAPRDAPAEINSLVMVHDWVKRKWRLKNVIIIGDLNADCDYIRKKDIPSIALLNSRREASLWTSPYKWLITDEVDTTVGNTNCAYDRIIVSGTYLNYNVVAGSAKAFEFDKAYKLETKLALNVSDHYPVEVLVHVEVGGKPDRIQSDDDDASSNSDKVFGAIIFLSVILFLL